MRREGLPKWSVENSPNSRAISGELLHGYLTTAAITAFPLVGIGTVRERLPFTTRDPQAFPKRLKSPIYVV
jgi:hypothetical protein